MQAWKTDIKTNMMMMIFIKSRMNPSTEPWGTPYLSTE